MYNVLLVDDEVNILEGIATIVNWAECGTNLIYKANNGTMALEYIMQNPPDIVVSDIKMPGLNGVELIKRVHQVYPHIKFIILSGHDEFEYAKTAMEYNVKYYLLKPSNETKIEEALSKVVSELNEQKRKEEIVTTIKNKLQDVLPKAKEQFLKELITNKKYGITEWEHFSNLFELKLESKRFILVVLEIDEDYDLGDIFALKEITESTFKDNEIVQLCTTIGERIILLCENNLHHLLEHIRSIKKVFSNLYNLDFTTGISDPGGVDELRKLYNEALDGLAQRFYLGNGSIISKNDIHKKEGYQESLQFFDHEDFIFSIRSGNINELSQYIEHFFEQLKKNTYEINLVKTHCLEMFMSIIRQAKKETMDQLFQKIIELQSFTTLEHFKEFIELVSVEVAQQNYDRTKEAQSEVIRNLFEYVEKNYCDETLSLSKIANDIFYMNPDYLGKLFKKEMGEKFSTYLVNLRLKKAIELIEEQDHVKMFEIAEKVGFGNNPRYFSQVFKKYTGVTPSEYRSSLLSS
ncbi:response regulator transcription factor [Ferdinandcohnia sp. Marseille-Q9671]